ncbi:polyadenylate-binding protein-interacting protein 9 isoform X1 [Beta vulgaris subsp. vulgaris]|uniref:polyadenylate-binding protein-interacting protein 9 isoform X1 n=1 Tax=Beta vulgaris subsp. vulgaris TaxID=3555 RepID=UPI0020370AAC|nr:polyadenylate-binding protein-interacting protein 9 isoform X1 [Beta vulgaris subsp. vulgaris]
MAAVAQNVVNSDDQFNKNCNSPTQNSETDTKSCDSNTEFQKNINELADILSKLNPWAKEFVPSSYRLKNDDQSVHNNFSPLNKISSNDNFPNNRRRRNSFNQGRRRMNGRAFRAQREESIRRTVYVSDIDQHVTEERLAALFSSCGQQVVDCRICGDPHSVLRFAFVEFADEQGARAALSLGGTMLGYYPVRVLPSKTAILPVNPTFLPRSEDEREMCARTVYCTNIDKKVSQLDVKTFFETACGEVSRLRLLGDNVHSTRIAFVEFTMAESAIMALNCSGMILGTQPIRVSPSKTPVRPRLPRPGN